MCSTSPSLNTMVQAAKLRLLSTLSPPFLLSAKAGSHSTTKTPLRNNAKFDELEAAGVFAKPEQVNVHVEYLNSSFFLKKPNGGSRLVTSFGEVAQYSKPLLNAKC